jgi:hypothetical protein
MGGITMAARPRMTRIIPSFSPVTSLADAACYWRDQSRRPFLCDFPMAPLTFGRIHQIIADRRRPRGRGKWRVKALSPMACHLCTSA